jgi:hypothetical protein
VIRRALLILSTVATAVVALSFLMFAADKLQEGSEEQILKLDQISRSDPQGASEDVREDEHGSARELIDDANDLLTRPFNNVIDSEDIWAERGLLFLVGLFFYGFALRFVARMANPPDRL